MDKKIINNNEKPVELYPLKNDVLHAIQVTDSLADIQDIWDELAPTDNIFLQSPYLRALETHAPEGMQFNYVVFYEDIQPVGIAYTQTFHISVQDSIKDEDEVENPACILKAFMRAIKQWVMKRADFNVLVCGNLLLTGEHGYSFKEEIDEAKVSDLVQLGIDRLHKILEQKEKIHIQLFKDYLPETETVQKKLVESSYHKFSIQPSMHMHLPSEWATFDDYLNAMSSKYRVRARRAAKKGKDLVKKELSLEEIQANEERIYELYKSIADGAGFNAFLLHPSYFTALKQNLGENYKLVGYYIGDEMVAFCTSIMNGTELEAHFLGVDGEANRKYQVYLNILYDFVRMGIYHKKESINLARTALEIKSSVGAVPQNMYCYLKHRSSLSSKFIKLVFESFNPKEEWQQRRPFKDKNLALGAG
ncbi:MAG: GNAT family N-acetyltransferase [Aureispira sp.]|nr:GNAT family N-acetyltransferase [Aureispira sp.]